MGGFNPDFHPELAEQDYYIGMGETAEILAEEGNISRDEQEHFSIESHKKALKAWENGHFGNEVVPIDIYGENIIEKDEGPRQPDLEKIKRLDPAFLEDGTITAATSSPISIGASAVLMCSRELAEKNDLSIRAFIKARSVVGVDWKQMGKGPIPATEKALKQAGMSMDDIDVIELNEAFASQGLATLRTLGVADDDPRVNPNGGAIAMGHPLGMSGARLVLGATYELKRSGGRYALCTMCVGVGQGTALILERV